MNIVKAKEVVIGPNNNNLIIEYEYDNLGRLIRQNTGQENNWQTSEFLYDARGNQIAMLDPLGNKFESYYSPDDKLITEVDPLGNKTSFEYDEVGNITLMIDPRGNAKDEDNKIVSHTGWWKGYRAYFIRNLNKQETLIVLSNLANQSAFSTNELQELF